MSDELKKLLKRSLGLKVKRADGEERVLNFTVSDRSIDRDGDIVEPAGWSNLEQFSESGVVLWNHDHSIPAIAAPVNPRIENDALVSGAKFPTPGKHQLADMLFGLLDEEIITSVSAGFMPEEFEPLEDDGDELIRGVRFTKQELYEFSVVNVPSNRNAVMERALKGAFRQTESGLLVKMGLLPRDCITVINGGERRAHLAYTGKDGDAELELIDKGCIELPESGTCPAAWPVQEGKRCCEPKAATPPEPKGDDDKNAGGCGCSAKDTDERFTKLERSLRDQGVLLKAFMDVGGVGKQRTDPPAGGGDGEPEKAALLASITSAVASAVTNAITEKSK